MHPATGRAGNAPLGSGERVTGPKLRVLVRLGVVLLVHRADLQA
jgi:hypothetical protein